jgi:peptidoglycan/LPS O-acetylase OafA/YrhL
VGEKCAKESSIFFILLMPVLQRTIAIVHVHFDRGERGISVLRSSSGVYLSNLDHLRFFAAFQVMVWHFVHTSPNCADVCFTDYVTTLPGLSLLEEGHTGVALFMCISGYLFAALTYENRVNIVGFWSNRALRLLPLLAFWAAVLLITEQHGEQWHLGISTLLAPGGWSIIVEIEFYILFPVILFAARRFGPWSLLVATVAFIALRGWWWWSEGSVFREAYWTLSGRIDQFLISIAAFVLTRTLSHRSKKILGLLGLLGIVISYESFNHAGGLNETQSSPLWVIWPTIEALCYSAIIVGYLQLKVPTRLGSVLAHLGTLSYSMYLAHFHLVPFVVNVAGSWQIWPDEFAGRLVLVLFMLLPLVFMFSEATYWIIERPFLRMRVRYLSAPVVSAALSEVTAH